MGMSLSLSDGISLSGGSGGLLQQVLALSPAALFDISNAATNLQERSTPTTPAGAGDPVGSLQNLGASGGYATPPSDAARPVRQTDGTYWWLEPDGSNDWMIITPTVNLGETWWHVGGWRVDANGKAAFATSTDFRGAPWRDISLWRWYNPSNTLNTIATPGSPGSVCVLTVEQADSSTLSGRYNGAGGQTITPYDDHAATQGLALFTQLNSSFANGMSGRFYGGAWGTGILTAGQRATVERWVAGLCGVSL